MIWSKLLKLKTKATFYGVAFCFCVSTTHAATPEKSTARKFIESAQKLFLQKERKQAISKLKTALVDPSLTPKERDELTDAIHQMESFFLTDKGQKIYELARTQLYVNPAQTVTQLQEARAVEDGNLSIELLAARAVLFQKDCKQALKILKTAEEYTSNSTDVYELQLSANLCAENFENLETLLKQRPPAVKPTSPLVRLVQARLRVQNDEPQRAFDILKDGVESGHPELIYWTWKTGVSLTLEVDDKASRYVTLCKTPTLALRQKFVNSPEICLRLTEVEAYLKAKAAETGDGP